MAIPPPRELKARFRAQLFTQFAHLEGAGVPMFDTLAAIARALPTTAERIERLVGLLRRGQTLAPGAVRCGLWLPWEGDYLQVVQTGGRLERGFARLEDLYTERALRISRLKAKLVYPAALLVLAVVVGPLPALLQGTMTLTGYGIYLVTTLLGWYLLLRLGVDGYRQLAARTVRLPFSLPLFYQYQRRDCCAALGLLLDAGLRADEALAQVRASVRDPQLHRALGAAPQAVRRGQTVTQALAAAKVVDGEWVGFVANGEAAGRLPETLEHLVRITGERLDHRLDLILGALPGIAYALVVGFFVVGII
ncbi:MAG: type II secretion system F family protein [Candidatus Competibacterales bacterium]